MAVSSTSVPSSPPSTDGATSGATTVGGGGDQRLLSKRWKCALTFKLTAEEEELEDVAEPKHVSLEKEGQRLVAAQLLHAPRTPR